MVLQPAGDHTMSTFNLIDPSYPSPQSCALATLFHAAFKGLKKLATSPSSWCACVHSTNIPLTVYGVFSSRPRECKSEHVWP